MDTTTSGNSERLCASCNDVIKGRAKHARYCHSCGTMRARGLYRTQRDADARACHQEVAKAIRAGLIPPATDRLCADCMAPAIEYDHRDYCYPLLIEPVCSRCNKRRGPAADASENTSNGVCP